MKKFVIAFVVLVLATPFLLKLIPEPVTYERIEAAYRARGYLLENVREESFLGHEETEGWSFFIEGYRVEVLRYSDRAKIATNFVYLKPDSGTLLVESMNIAQSLGATRPTEKTHAERRDMFIVYVRGADRAKCTALARVIHDA